MWNPRIVGANVYITYDGNGKLEDPLWLAKIDFRKDGESISHDGQKAEGWTASSTNYASYQLLIIPTVPVLTYRLKNGYLHDENIHAIIMM